jgi:hypothetical protein
VSEILNVESGNLAQIIVIADVEVASPYGRVLQWMVSKLVKG